MARTKIDYGIDLGTTNSAIVRMESGNPKPIRTDTLKDTMPSCVGFNKKGSVMVGDAAANSFRSAALNALKTLSDDPNFYVEFKRTMGTDKPYSSSHMDTSFTSEDLSAEVLKKLRAFVTDDDVPAAVITVPAKFTTNQADATARAAKMAGFDQFELLHEPIAAAWAYGLGSEAKEGKWLVFDMGGGTFDVALAGVSEGIIKILDTEGDNHLGGKNIDYAIVQDILIPHLGENFSIDSYIEQPRKNEYFRNVLKLFAEPAKIRLSFQESDDITSELGEFPDDDEGTELELDFKLTRDTLRPVEAPIFQKAIDLCHDLLRRNGIKGSDLTALILVGGPTYSPNLRRMLAEQITDKVDTSVDPMTAVARGAAIYASTIDRSEEVIDAVRDRGIIQLELGYDATTVDETTLLTIKLLTEKTERDIPEKIVAEVISSDGAWSSNQFPIDTLGEAVDLPLKVDRANTFTIRLFDGKGTSLDCEPNEFTILQGIGPGSAILNYGFGIEIKQNYSDKLIYRPVPGLEKNSSYPAKGVVNGLKTQKTIGPGSGQKIIIPLYQGEHAAEDTRAIYNEHVYDVQIAGDDLPAVLPEGSEVDLTFHVVKEGDITISAYLPLLEFTHPIKVPTGTVQKEVDPDWLDDEIDEAYAAVAALESDERDVDAATIDKFTTELDDLQELLDQARDDYDRKQQVLNGLRKVLRAVEKVEAETDWPAAEKKLRDALARIEEYWEKVRNDVDDINEGKVRGALARWKEQVPQVIADRDPKLAVQLTEEINGLGFALTDAALGWRLYAQWVREYDEEFDDHKWSDPNKARILINRGLSMSADDSSRDRLRGLILELYDLLPSSDRKGDVLTDS